MYIEAVNRILSDDKYAALSGIELVSVDEVTAVVRAAIEPKHLNADGVVQGGMLFTLADFAFAMIANYVHPVTVTQSAQINFIAPARTEYVTATAVELVRRRKTCIVQIIVRDATETVVCTATINGFIKGLPEEGK